ncbi:MAG: NAD(P)/FAD-dependent oxidoreductase [Beijerinckiaceae bacterium]
MSAEPPIARPRIVIVGAGFAGLSAAKALAGADVEVTLIDRQNHHLFQPLLYQVATAGLSPADIATPIRSILRHQANVSVRLGEVQGVDRAAKVVLCDRQKIAYDILVLATGARHGYFNRDDWAKHAPGIKTLDDATAMRRKILLAFERAENEASSDERRRLQTFVVVGGGPTGVEMAGAIAELASRAMAADFRRIEPRKTRVVLVEGGQRLLASFDERSSEKARRSLERIGVDVRLGRPVTTCDDHGVVIGENRIESRTIVWAAGIAASPAASWLDAESDRVGRVKVDADLSLAGHPEIFVVGDTACALGSSGKPLPGVAPVAKQQGEFVSRQILRGISGKPRETFVYRDNGSMATIGRKSAIAEIGRFKISGFPAWLLWCVAHVYFLIGFRNRLTVAMTWAWSYLTFQRGARLITGMPPAEPETQNLSR